MDIPAIITSIATVDIQEPNISLTDHSTSSLFSLLMKLINVIPMLPSNMMMNKNHHIPAEDSVIAGVDKYFMPQPKINKATRSIAYCLKIFFMMIRLPF